MMPGGTGQERGAELISVIMPCFNAEPFVAEAVASALGQTYGNVELIVVDDGSTDRSREILARLAAENPGRMKVLHQHNAGPYPARNLALREARGAYVAFLDADDYWDGDCLDKLYSAVKVSGADLAYCGWQNIGIDGPHGQPYIPPRYETEDPVARFLKGCPWPIHAALVRREVIDAVGGFSERYFSSMDYDLWLRILAVTKNMVLAPEVLAFYRWHGNGQISSVKWKQALDAWQVRRDFISANPRLVAHLASHTVRELTDGFVLKSAYKAYWTRDLVSARHLFQKALAIGYWKVGDLRYLLPSLLPEDIYRRLIRFLDRTREAKTQ